MGVTQSEIDKFLEFFDSESYDAAVKFLNSKVINTCCRNYRNKRMWRYRRKDKISTTRNW